MDPEEATDLAERVSEFYVDEIKVYAKMVEEHVKAMAAIGGAKIMSGGGGEMRG